MIPMIMTSAPACRLAWRESAVNKPKTTFFGGNELWNPGRELLMVPGRQGMKNHHSPLNGVAENAARAWDSFARHISPRIEENL